MLTFAIYEGKDLRDVNMMLKMDPYYSIDIERQQRIVGRKCHGGGKNPHWKDSDF